jgi:hypothetical protein
VLGVLTLSLSTILIFDFGIFPTLIIFGFHFITDVSGVICKNKKIKPNSKI